MSTRPSRVRQFVGDPPPGKPIKKLPRFVTDTLFPVVGGRFASTGATAFPRSGPTRTMLEAILDADHRLVKAVRRIDVLRVTRRPGNPQSPDAVRALAATLGKHAPTLWALCLTGMRRGEYWGRRFSVLTDRVAVRGTKSAAAVRELPKVYAVALPTCEYRWFKGLLSEATHRTVRVHDLRYTWMRWLEEAGVPEMRIRFYAGHAVKDVSELYRRGRGFAEHLATDARRVRAWLGDSGPAQALEVVR